MAAEQPARLSVQVSRLTVYALVSVIGSVDFGTYSILSEQMDHALELTRVALIVDMSAVDFCDSSGLNVFAQTIRKARSRGVALVVVGLRDRVARVFNVTQIDQAMHALPDLETAVRWLETGSAGTDAS
jgi:anti-anti-sigma factor